MFRLHRSDHGARANSNSPPPDQTLPLRAFAPLRLCVKKSEARLLRDLNEDFQGTGRGPRSQRNGTGGFIQRKTARDQPAHVEPARENEPGGSALQGEVGGVAADQVFFVQAD